MVQTYVATVFPERSCRLGQRLLELWERQTLQALPYQADNNPAYSHFSVCCGQTLLITVPWLTAILTNTTTNWQSVATIRAGVSEYQIVHKQVMMVMDLGRSLINLIIRGAEAIHQMI